MNDTDPTVEPWSDEDIAGHVEASLRDFDGNELEADLVKLVQLVRDEIRAEADEVMAGNVQRAHDAIASMLNEKDARIAELERDNATLRAQVQAAGEWMAVAENSNVCADFDGSIWLDPGNVMVCYWHGQYFSYALPDTVRFHRRVQKEQVNGREGVRGDHAT